MIKSIKLRKGDIILYKEHNWFGRFLKRVFKIDLGYNREYTAKEDMYLLYFDEPKNYRIIRVIL